MSKEDGALAKPCSLEAEFRNLFARGASEVERDRLIALDANCRGLEFTVSSGGGTVLSPLSGCLVSRRRRRALSVLTLFVLVALFLVLQVVTSPDTSSQLQFIARSGLAGLALAAVHLFSERLLNVREREAVHIVELARRGDVAWMDGYARWLEESSASKKSKWRAIPWAMFFVAAIFARELPGLPEPVALAVSVAGIAAAYLCLRLLMLGSSRRSASTNAV